MTEEMYCKMVEEKDRQNKQLIPLTPIIDNNTPLVSLKETGFNLFFEPSIMKGHRYYVREPIVEKIGRISKLLDKSNKQLIIRSAWRSFKHQKRIWDNKVASLKKTYPEKSIEEIEKMVYRFIAPQTKSMHTTGGAVDALILDLEDGSVLDFGTNEGFKIDLSDQCYPYHPDISERAKENRKLLIHLFEREGFVVDVKEYWHFDYGNVIWAIENKKDHAIFGLINP